jgi:hypothetical protein
MEPCHKDVMMKRFRCSNGEGLSGKIFKQPVTIIPNSSVLEIGKGGEVVLVDSGFRRSILKVDNVVLANVRANDSLYEEYRDAGLLVTRIGDAKEVRNLRGAVTDGANLGLTLDKDLQFNANTEVVATLPTDTQL